MQEVRTAITPLKVQLNDKCLNEVNEVLLK